MSSIRDFFPVEYKFGTKPKKNFILENRKNVTKLSRSNQASKENDYPSDRQCSRDDQKFKSLLGQNKDSNPDNPKKPLISKNLDKIDASIKSIRTAIAQTKITQEKLGIKIYDKAPLAFRDQGTQTINPYSEENVFQDSIIRYPKSKRSDIGKITQMKHMNTISVQTENSDSEYSDCAPKKNLKHMKRSDDINSKKKSSNLDGFKENITAHHQPGEIPKYLKDRKVLKEKNEKETQKKLAIRRALGLDDPACPPGHVLLPEPERLDHLAKIKKDYDRLIMELNMLPVSSDSYKMKEKRKHIEKELDKVLLGIKLFSREKLFVKVNSTTISNFLN